MEERLAAELLVDIAGGTATVTLNRPAALNALSFGMLEGLASHLDAWEDDDSVERIVFRGSGERAFCAGGDIRSLYHGVKVGSREPLRFMEVEYALDLRIHEYRKPIAALIDGIVMGGGMGISQGASMRVVGARTRMAMPETVIGLFPDVGGSYFLSRVPGKVGLYLGLVGPTIDAADALYCNLADIHLDRAAVDHFDFDTAKAVGASALPGSNLEGLRPAIDDHFSQADVPAIMDSLRREDREPFRAWAAETLVALEKRSPTMLDVTFEQIRRGAVMSIAECLRMELHLIERAFEHGDLLEGIRALIIDKDNQPRWKQRVPIEHFFNQGNP